MKLELELDIPDDLVDSEFTKRLREDVVLRLFAGRKIPSSRAASLPGIGRMALLDLLTQRGIPAVDYTVDDWEKDGAGIDAIERRLPNSGSKR